MDRPDHRGSRRVAAIDVGVDRVRHIAVPALPCAMTRAAAERPARRARARVRAAVDAAGAGRFGPDTKVAVRAVAPLHRVLAMAMGVTAVTALAGETIGNARPPEAHARFESARDQYELGRYQTAFDAFTSLADDGHCEAARIAHQMARYGRPLYGIAFTVAPARLDQWRRRPGCSTTESEK